MNLLEIVKQINLLRIVEKSSTAGVCNIDFSDLFFCKHLFMLPKESCDACVEIELLGNNTTAEKHSDMKNFP